MHRCPRHFVALALGAALAAPVLVLAAASRTWTFQDEKDDRRDAPPAGFSFALTGDGRPGRWLVLETPGASAGARVLAQLDQDETDYRFPLAIVPAVDLKDLRLAVKCKPVDGKVDQACGLVLRYQDENRYYVARLNALENNVRLYHVWDGRRIQFAGWNGKVTKNAWHELSVAAQGDRFEVLFDGRKVIEASDRTITSAGKVGVWTKSDSVAYFDDLTVTPLP
jgi:hypothetical protein